MAMRVDLFELARHLKQERLFVNSQRDQLQKLFEKVKSVAEDVYHDSWIARQHRNNLDGLIKSSQDFKPSDCCLRTNQLESTTFVDSYKYLKYHDTKYGDLLKFLRENPQLLASCLVVGESTNAEVTQKIIASALLSVYGNCALQEDEVQVLQMLKTLLEIQLANSDNPRRLLRKASCSFSVAFKSIFDSVFSAKLFLTAALHDPVMRLLMEDEWFYDIDPGKALIRFPPSERLRKFGEPGTDEYKTKLKNYRALIVDKLVQLSSRFINSIKSNLHCFPPSLSWIVSQVFQTLSKNDNHNITDVRAVCADLVFSLFICPAICDPEPLGITSDIPISHIARHNLMQIAQIIQVLAISQWTEVDSKQDLYGKFEKGCMSSFLDSLLEGVCVELPSPASSQIPSLARNSTLMTLPHINNLVGFLRNNLADVSAEDNAAEKKQLQEMLGGLPATAVCVTDFQNRATPTSTPSQTPPDTPVSSRKMSSKAKKKILSPVSNQEEQPAQSPTTELSIHPSDYEEVLVISHGADMECPGMLTEKKVLSWEQENRRRRVKYDLSQDQESIGNTSDIQEAVSEGASSHSVGSVDLENDNDNFSDMISANVSGRGTPNISGRDTPLSQAESVEEHRAPDLPETVQKNNREDVTERFGKFEIKAEFERDETKSTVSDTWSTDVLASDSEPPEQNQFDRLEEISEEMVQRSLLVAREGASEFSETASDAWSTDVLASDTEDKQVDTLSEFDQDDIGSVTDQVANPEDLGNMDGQEANEETPLGSGVQSLTEVSRLNNFCAEACATGGDIPKLFVIPSDKRRASVPAEKQQQHDLLQESSYKETEDIDRNRGIYAHPHINHAVQAHGLVIPLKQRHSASLKHAEGRVVAVLSSMEKEPKGVLTHSDIEVEHSEPLVGKPIKQKPQKRISFPLEISTFLNPNPPESSEDSVDPLENLVVERRSSAKQENDTSDQVFLRERSSKKLDNVKTLPEENVNISSAATSMPLPEDPTPEESLVASIDNLTENTEGLKLTEQQNTKVNEQRLSCTLNMVDPLSLEAQDGVELIAETGSRANSFVEVIPVITKSETNGDSGPVIISESILKSRPEVVRPIPQRAQHSSLELPSGVRSEVSLLKDRRDSAGSSHSSGSAGMGDNLVYDKNRSASIDTALLRSEEKKWLIHKARTSNTEYIETDEPSFSKHKKEKGGLLWSFKEKIHKGIKRKGVKNDREEAGDRPDGEHKGKSGDSSPLASESADDILARYRPTHKKPTITTQSSDAGTTSYPDHKEKRFSIREDDTDRTTLYDPNNLESCFAFLDTKRKLRLVLSTGDFHIGGNAADFWFWGVPNSPREVDSRKENNELVKFLRAQLAEAINLQNKSTIAQLHEAIRCVRMFDTEGCKKLIRSLQEDYKNRSLYIAYLIRCEQGLLTTFSHLERLLNRIQRDKEICKKHLINVCVRLFLESKERNVMAFIADFQRQTVADEKTLMVERFLQQLYQSMNNHVIWQGANESQFEDAQLSIERFLMSRIYTHAMFPNSDGDIMRDQLIHQHINKLSQVVTPSHQDIAIAKVYHFECPWPAAQREIYMINAYKTPKDKLQCVLRCSTTIMNLLSMANDKSVPAADDFIPVLIYVIIRANPPCLFSTIQYVNSFYGNRMAGEEQYWWMQFSSAVEFIKTMDYSD